MRRTARFGDSSQCSLLRDKQCVRDKTRKAIVSPWEMWVGGAMQWLFYGADWGGDRVTRG